MSALVAWRILTHEITRSVVAVLGVFAAIVLVFLQMGFYSSVPLGSMLVYEALSFDIALISRDYSFQINSHHFPRRRLFQALALPEVKNAVPFYQLYGRWLNSGSQLQREVFVMGVDPDKEVFRLPDLERQRALLKRPDTTLVDDATRMDFGPLFPATIVEVNGRRMEIVGTYSLGTGFLGTGVMLVSDQNFVRLFPENTLDDVQFGLVSLRRGASLEAAVQRLREILPLDTQVLSRDEFASQEIEHWLNSTSTGLVFGFGIAVAATIGALILFQTLSTMIHNNIREFAVLKAMGYGDGYLTRIVIGQALLIAVLAIGPAVVAAYWLYDVTREATLLPVFMTTERIVIILMATFVMALAAAALTLRVLKHAEPADLF